MVVAEDSDFDNVIVKVGLNENDQPNVLMSNLGNKRKLVQKS